MQNGINEYLDKPQESILQMPYQTFPSEGFKVACDCKLYANILHIQMARQQGIYNIVNAYVCAENENNPDMAVITNINISDVSEIYKNVPTSNYSLAEKSYLDEYAANLRRNGVTSSYTSFQGGAALEYNFDLMGIPTKAIIIVKNKKSYLLQVASKRNLTSKYNTLKSSLVFL